MSGFPAWVEVDLDALRYNLEWIRSIIPADTGILLVVKADAYGHGSVRISRFAADCGVEMFGVATLDEGKELRRAGVEQPVLILSPVLPDEIEEAIENDLAIAVSSYRFAEAVSETAVRMGKTCSIHIEIDTGMGRAGLNRRRSVEEITAMRRLENVNLEGIFTHFPAADCDMDFTTDQISLFTRILGELESAKVSFRYVHCSNSAAILNFPSSCFNLVRPGLLAYGYSPSISLSERVNVLPVMSFKARLVLVKDMPQGSSISYGRTFIAQHESKIGVVPVGYGHGISHRLSNVGSMLFRGEKVPVVGRVTMDMTMIDLTAFPDAHEGEEVVIFGCHVKGKITADDIAEQVGTLNYEVLCHIGKRVARVYLLRGKVESMKTLLGAYDNS